MCVISVCSHTEPLSFVMRGCPPALLTFLHARRVVLHTWESLRTRTHPNRDKSWEMMPSSHMCAPAGSSTPQAKAIPPPAAAQQSLGMGRSLQPSEGCAQRGRPSPYTFPPVLSQPSPSRTSTIALKTSAWMLQSAGRQHEEGLPTTHYFPDTEQRKRINESHISQHQLQHTADHRD